MNFARFKIVASVFVTFVITNKVAKVFKHLKSFVERTDV
jgi:hypothetical protein